MMRMIGTVTFFVDHWKATRQHVSCRRDDRPQHRFFDHFGVDVGGEKFTIDHNIYFLFSIIYKQINTLFTAALTEEQQAAA